MPVAIKGYFEGVFHFLISAPWIELRSSGLAAGIFTPSHLGGTIILSGIESPGIFQIVSLVMLLEKSLSLLVPFPRPPLESVFHGR